MRAFWIGITCHSKLQTALSEPERSPESLKKDRHFRIFQTSHFAMFESAKSHSEKVPTILTLCKTISLETRTALTYEPFSLSQPRLRF